jgi:cell division protein FtsB
LSGSDAIERHERTLELPHLSPLARRIAVIVAVLAGMLAVSEVIAENRIAKVITYETRIAHHNGTIETDAVKAALGKRVRPVAAVEATVARLEDAQDAAETAHHRLELAIVLLQVGIVLASVTALVGVRWLLYVGTGVGAAGAAFLVAGVLA